MNHKKCEYCSKPFEADERHVKTYCSSLCSKKAYMKRLKLRDEHTHKELPPLYNHRIYRCPKCGGAINHKNCFACSLKENPVDA
jgi:predicted nucleic acid-binding Zn ribbon protein